MATIGDLIERNARYHGDVEAYVFEGQRQTYSQYAERVRRLGSSLYDLGMRRQDRVAVLSTNSIEYFEVYGAAEWAGYIVTLVNFRLSPSEIVQILKDADPKVLIFEEQYAAMVGLVREQLQGIVHFVCVGGESGWALPYASLIQEGAESGPPIRSRPEDFCHLFYTSGTTGRPKGVPHNHLTAWNAAERTTLNLGVNGSSRMLQVTPAFHVGGKGSPLASMLNGSTLVLQRAFNPVAMLEEIQNERVTHTFMVAAMLQAVLDVPGRDLYDTSSLVSIMTGAAPIPVPVLKRGIEAFGKIFSVQYGMTEIFGPVSVLPSHEVNPNGTAEQIQRLASVGHVAPELEFRIVDEDGAESPAGTAGEICVKSPYQLSGYWNNTLATLDAISDGWYHTGDMGYLGEGGYLFLVDRKKDMIISGGENIYSREVENAMFQHPVVLDVAVIGAPDPLWGESVKAIVVLKPGEIVSPADLITYCKTMIASYKCPKSVELVSELPHLASGKVDKVSLRQRYCAQG
ncbi:class I adenylate-forming enzyme family protein [Pseudomonas sp. BF-R-19]|uniref:class I adenylate-forming enzyme family protein n=1 Tax=Pseudomonas sp. BF-R-19 TaxID=2832397 RepID=UPI001CBA8AF9|nr:long-chain-fatty-acid--CoA ligase [Pseudomonas sp. BF-R-19]